MSDARIEGTSDIQEMQVLGDWAWLRTYLEMRTISPDAGAPVCRSGHTLAILRKEPDGRWRPRAMHDLLAQEK